MRSLRFRPWWIAGGCAIALAILLGSLLPMTQLPSVKLWDKAEHTLAYVILAFWFGGVFERRAYFRLAGVLLGFGIVIEVAQGTMAIGRVGDLRDVAANAIGIAVGLTLASSGLGGWMRTVERMLVGTERSSD